jgi:geranylgeranyl pyrophosphate synthase
MVQLFGMAVDATTDGLADIAVAAELIHSASLLHDDVIDEADQRRGRTTVNAEWGSLAAILSGDLVLTQAFLGLVRWPRCITNGAVRVVSSMTRAALFEADSRGNAHLSLDHWHAIAEGKTGALLAWCGRSAGQLAELDDAAERFARCGQHLGVAYQLADDLRDIVDLDGGKPLFADIRNRNPSYPVLHTAENDSSFREELSDAWRQPDINEDRVTRLGSRVVDGGAPLVTFKAIASEIATGLTALGPYRSTEGGLGIEQWASALYTTLPAERLT